MKNCMENGQGCMEHMSRGDRRNETFSDMVFTSLVLNFFLEVFKLRPMALNL